MKVGGASNHHVKWNNHIQKRKLLHAFSSVEKNIQIKSDMKAEGGYLELKGINRRDREEQERIREILYPSIWYTYMKMS